MEKRAFEELQSWVLTKNVQCSAVRPLDGGSASENFRILLSDGTSVVVKTSAPGDSPNRFPAESRGLESLRIPGAPKVPAIEHVSERILILEDLRPIRPRGNFWETFGIRMAAVHSVRGPAYGFFEDGFLGRTPVGNEWLDDGWAFFAGRRLLPLLRACRDAGLLSPEECRLGERMASRLRELLPGSPAVLLHGDLWAGNILSDESGTPCLVDPSAHYGWAESDIAMTFLFAGVPEAFHRAWESTYHPDPGWRDRVPIHNTVHLLNHLLLFGTTYREGVMDTLRRHGG